MFVGKECLSLLVSSSIMLYCQNELKVLGSVPLLTQNKLKWPRLSSFMCFFSPLTGLRRNGGLADLCPGPSGLLAVRRWEEAGVIPGFRFHLVVTVGGGTAERRWELWELCEDKEPSCGLSDRLLLSSCSHLCRPRWRFNPRPPPPPPQLFQGGGRKQGIVCRRDWRLHTVRHEKCN